MSEAAARARLATFYGAHWRRLWAFLVRMGAEPALAQDIAQDSFVRWALSPALNWEERRARAYLYTTAHRLLIDHHRRRRRDVPLDIDFPAAMSEGDFVLAGAWRKLDAKERILLWLAYAEEFSHAEIAEIVGVGAASVKVLLSRMREKARIALEGDGE